MSGSGAIRATAPTVRVLEALLEDPGGCFYGFELLAHAEMKSGTLYPILARLERAGWLASHWEEADPRLLSRPRRRYYLLTSQGRELSVEAVREFRKSRPKVRESFRPRPWAPEPA